jgi:hypothetical protein
MLKDDFNQLRNRLPAQGQESDEWKNPLDTLAGLVPQVLQEDSTTWTCDPHLILRSDSSAEEWETLALEAKNIMAAYNRSLTLAIAADKDASKSGSAYLVALDSKSCLELQGLQEDEKRTDLMNATFIAKHFPRKSLKVAMTSVLAEAMNSRPEYIGRYAEIYAQSFCLVGCRFSPFYTYPRLPQVFYGVSERQTGVRVAWSQMA